MAEYSWQGKKRLLEEFKQETIEQLHALKDEDAERFLQRVERCERIIQLIQALGTQGEPSAPLEKEEKQSLLGEIASLRQQVEALMHPLYDKLKKGMLMERQRSKIERAYVDDEYYPAVFVDKKN
jgi:hypothetical protein